MEYKDKFKCNNLLFVLDNGIKILCEDLYLYDKIPKFDIRCDNCKLKYKGKFEYHRKQIKIKR